MQLWKSPNVQKSASNRRTFKGVSRCIKKQLKSGDRMTVKVYGERVSGA